MIVSALWLRAFVEHNLSDDELVETLTLAGLEVDEVSPAGPSLPGVIVGRVTGIVPHPDADKLRVCEVDVGTESLSIVCGAANVHEHMTVAVATVGAELPNGTKIKKAALRGVESSGMLCSAAELGLAESADGLLALPNDLELGRSVSDALQLDDACIDIDLTPNRGDCLSILGVAREVSALTGADLRQPHIEPVPAVNDVHFGVTLASPSACPRYAGRVIKNVDAGRDTPFWMAERLRRSGIRPISPLVDITNYVLLELGQPMHVFDLDQLKEGIVVRHAAPGESITRLDGTSSELDAATLVIADAQGPVAIAGVMGGEQSAVSSETKNVFLEAAFFEPEAHAGTARRYKLHTDASHRFERGVDFELAPAAGELATQLILDICGGEPGPLVVTDAAEHLPTTPSVTLRRARIAKILGIEIPDSDILRILEHLGCEVTATEDGWLCTSPSFRFDLVAEIDYIEELARVHGYDKVPASPLSVEGQMSAVSDEHARRRIVTEAARGRDYHQVITYSFIAPAHAEPFLEGRPAICLDNPISSEMSVMRPSMIPGLLNAAAYNLNRQVGRVRLFEEGVTFVREKDGDELVQAAHLAGLAVGPRTAEQWSSPTELIDFYDIKGDVEAIIASLGFHLSGPVGPAERVSFVPVERPYLCPGQAAAIQIGQKPVGIVGAVHPNLKKKFDLKSDCYIFDLMLNHILDGRPTEFSPPSKFPSVRRDLAILVDESVPYADVYKSVTESAGPLLRDLQLFDVYRGQSIENGKKNLALGLIFQAASSTLKDDQVDAIVESVLAALKHDVAGGLRE